MPSQDRLFGLKTQIQKHQLLSQEAIVTDTFDMYWEGVLIAFKIIFVLSFSTHAFF